MTKLHPICKIASFETIKANMKKLILAIILSLGSFSAWAAKAPSSASCAAKLIYYEARGESKKVMKGVLQVAMNRARIDKMSLCQVIFKKSQFPWVARVKSWKLTQDQVDILFEIIQMMPVVSRKAYYFNSTRMAHGVRHRRIGRMWFAEKEINSNI